MPSSPGPTTTAHIRPYLPVAPVRRLVEPLVRFLQIESTSGLVLFACTLFALIIANTSAARGYHEFWHTPLLLRIGTFQIGGPLGHFFVNDLLMTIFFFVVGLEIKRELIAGELRDPRKAALPVAAALGGMIVPAAIYAALQSGQRGAHGWGIPMATDIAFVVGAMALLGARVPFGLKIMLLSLAIADDIGAVIVIAVFYSADLNFFMLLLAAGGISFTAILTEVGVRSIWVYVVIGSGVWLAFHKSGVHPTLAGVILGLMTPATAWVSRIALRLSIADLQAQLGTSAVEEVAVEDLELVAFAARESVSPLERLEHRLHPWVGFLIMPLFALANAGVSIDRGELTSAVASSVALGLLLGKPLGIMLLSFVAVLLGLARLPEGVTWRVLFGGSCLAGIGFTMSLFVTSLAFEHQPELVGAGKLGTILGSVVSALLGTAILVLGRRVGRVTGNEASGVEQQV
jgi:NhaA family Na+:H+ antiporter